jgi:cell division protein FtsZ
MAINLQIPQNILLKPTITVFGVGGAGGNAVNNMIASSLQGATFVVANTDAQALEGSFADKKIQLGASTTRGLGAGANPDVGASSAEESSEDIKKYLEGSNMIFITAGMGGGTGTGAAPVIAKMAKEQGILTVAVATKPFHFEGAHRMRTAEAGLKELQKYVDTLIIIPNQNLFRIANENTTFADAFKMADNVLHAGVRGVTDLMMMPGLINLDFADIRTVMSEMGKAMMGTGEATGEDRAIRAAEAAIANPLLDHCSMRGAKGVLINITGGPDMTLFEVDAAANRIRNEVGDGDANIIFGSTFNQDLTGIIRVSVVATGIDQEEVRTEITKSFNSVYSTATDSTDSDIPAANSLLEEVQKELETIVEENNSFAVMPEAEEPEVMIEKSNEYSIETVASEKSNPLLTTRMSRVREEEEEEVQTSSMGSLFNRVTSIFSSTKLFSPSENTSVRLKKRSTDEEDDDMVSDDVYDVPAFLRNKKK